MRAEDKAYLDSLDDEMFIAHMLILYGTYEPVWKRCSKKEYEKHCGKTGRESLTIDDILKFAENTSDGKIYRAVPIFNNGGGILDQISGKRPDDFIYEKLIGYRKVLLLGSEMIEYCKTRECMKPFLSV